MEKFTPLASKNFTLPPAVTALINSTSGNCWHQEEKVTNCGYLSTLALITIGNVKIVLSFLFISVRNSEITHLWKLPQLKSIWFSYKFFCWNSSARIKSVSSFKLLLRDSLREIGKEAQTPKANFITMKK